MRHHKSNFHLYADDTQLYLTFIPSTSDLAKLAIEGCVRDIDAWMIADFPSEFRLEDRGTAYTK